MNRTLERRSDVKSPRQPGLPAAVASRGANAWTSKASAGASAPTPRASPARSARCALSDEERGQSVRVVGRPASRAGRPAAAAGLRDHRPRVARADGPPTGSRRLRPLCRTNGATSGPTSPASAAARGAAKYGADAVARGCVAEPSEARFRPTRSRSARPTESARCGTSSRTGTERGGPPRPPAAAPSRARSSCASLRDVAADRFVAYATTISSSGLVETLGRRAAPRGRRAT